MDKTYQQLNEEQQAAAFCTDNAVVAAGAGSGKTLVLANRFAWLLTEKGYKVDEILTLTFTKKAAAQMYRRIHSQLTMIAEDEPGIKAQRARQALDDFIHARIQTLDSYSTSIVKQCAPRYGISPDFRIDQDRSNEIACEESLPFLITHRRHPAIERLYSDNRPKDIAGAIFADVLTRYCQIGKARDFLVDVKKQFDIICVEWKNHCDELVKILKEIDDAVSDNPDLLPDINPLIEKYKGGKIEIPGFESIRAYFDLLLSLPQETCIESSEAHPLQKSIVIILYYLKEICDLNLRKGKKTDNPVKASVHQLREFFGRFSSLAVFCMQAGFILSITPLFTELQQRYLTRKRTEGILTFSDVANLAKTILLEQEDIRQSEKESFKAIMIDEFQDNNELQKDLLFLLAEKPDVKSGGVPSADNLSPGKLFFVGDEKQSIYFFRGADVSVFRRLKDELKSADLPLKLNYRSSPQLIGAFNAIFGGSDFDPAGIAPPAQRQSVFAPVFENSPALPLFEAAYTPLKAGIEGEGKLSLCILVKEPAGGEDLLSSDSKLSSDNKLSGDENEARFTAEKIKGLLNEKNETGGQKYQPKDIALLFRTRNAQHLFEKQLRLLDIPYTCEDINDFFYGGLVNDIMSVLRLAARPLDSAAYAQMLRSPFAGLSLPGTAVCLAAFKAAKTPEPFSDEPFARLPEADQHKYRNGQKIFSSISEKAAGGSISSLVSELWYKEGYRYECEWNSRTSVYRELFDYLFYLAVKADAANQGLAAFTDEMRDRESGKGLKDADIPLERPSAVHLLTIHKSKGLEFPVVFLCCCGKDTHSDRRSEVYLSDEAGIVFSPPLPYSCSSIPDMRKNFFWEKSIVEMKRKRTAELRRLLYVAMTRAEKELYVTGNIDIRNDEATGDFSLKIKNYIENKCKDKTNSIHGDMILDNDTFFGLLLPAIASHIPVDGCSQGSDFFTLEPIPVYTENYINEWEAKSPGLSNDQKGLNIFFKQVEKIYQKAAVIKTPVIRNNHITPVSLRNMNDGEDTGRSSPVNKEFSGEKSDDIFNRVDAALARFSENGDDYGERFNTGSFGTIAHICAEAHFNGKEPVIPPNLSGFLAPAEADTFLAAGRELAVRFARSPLGKIAESAGMRESEFPFRSLVRKKTGEKVFINGTIDLFFEDDESIHIVDFKTDIREIPSEHFTQMTCYYRAVSSVFAIPAKKECRAWLYYLRTGHAIDITQKVKQLNLENIVTVS
ncbi:MAG: UvrD-helicase domain-containing protein [Treponema sp.]|jgi:ATP-dependent helicase/nuclease subunit A|nr:UvrD-helicase domain-containing protein [Treponema sp.]